MIDSSFKHKARKTLRKHLTTNPAIKNKMDGKMYTLVHIEDVCGLKNNG